MKIESFYFGITDSSSSCVKIEATSLAHAIKAFKLEYLEPEKFVRSEFVDQTKTGETYDGDGYHNIMKEGMSPMIDIHQRQEVDREHYEDRWKKIGEVSLFECVNAEWSDINLGQLLLPGQVTDSTALSVVGDDDDEKGLQLTVKQMPRSLMREQMCQMQRMRYELEQKRRELTHRMDLIKAELKEKLKVLMCIETFMGLREEIVILQQGANADQMEPLHIHQLVCYMDEEIGIWEEGGLDWQSIETFDAWILKNYPLFMHHPKSIVAFKVRRKDKEYCKITDFSTALYNQAMNEDNHKTYFLIRNGENFYRIYSDIDVGTTLFPIKARYERMQEEYKERQSDSILKDIKEYNESFLYGLAAMQGLLDRTEIFGRELQNRINLFTGTFCPGELVLVKDAEQDHWIGNGKPTFIEYLKANRATITKGTRVLVTSTLELYESEGRNSCARPSERYRGLRPDNSPSRKEIFIVESARTGDKAVDEKNGWYTGSWSSTGGKWLIRFHPGDDVTDLWTGERHERKNRVPCELYEDEAVNFDLVTEEDCEYYIKNRYERPEYLRYLPLLHYIRECRREERAYDEAFIGLVMSQMELGEGSRPLVRGTVTWWKLKNLWKRGLKADEPKALRMVIQRVTSQLRRGA